MKKFLWVCAIVLGIALLVSMLILILSVALSVTLMSTYSSDSEFMMGLIMIFFAVGSLFLSIISGVLLAVVIKKLKIPTPPR